MTCKFSFTFLLLWHAFCHVTNKRIWWWWWWWPWHLISQRARTIVIKLAGNICYPQLMTWLDSGGRRSRSQLAIEVVLREHHISWTTFYFSNFVEAYREWLLDLPMTWLDFEGHWSKVKVISGQKMWWQRHPRWRWGVTVHLLIWSGSGHDLRPCLGQK